MATEVQREAVAQALTTALKRKVSGLALPRDVKQLAWAMEAADEIIAAYEAAAPGRFCKYPVIAGMHRCCGNKPCTLEWRRPCDDTGGCLDRATCGGCDEPVFPEDADYTPKDPAHG